ncbi:MAG: TSUP family transporter [Mariniblastus sp.]|nr:TSUP family transporter [Mariniblastus sp.]
MIDFLGYLVGLIVGVVLGLLGGGGSLLAVPMLLIFDKSAVTGSAYVTILVGVSALFALMPRIRMKLVDWPTVLALGIPVSISTLLTRVWLIHAIPDMIPVIGISKKSFVLLVIAVLLLLSWATMVGLIGKNIKSKANLKYENPLAYYLTLTFCGLLMGVGPALAGAGGGVLIVPLLVIFFGLPIKTVVGTTLAIVVCKSFFGFCGDLIKLGLVLEYQFLFGFGAVMILGVLIGTVISNKVDGEKLKTLFGWFLLCMAIFITANELFIAK